MSVLLVAPEFVIYVDAMEELVIAGRMWVVKVTVRVDFAEDTEAQPAEILLTRSARHLVTAIHFLYVGSTAWAVFAVLFQPVSAEGFLHSFLDHSLPKALLHELLALRGGRQVLVS